MLWHLNDIILSVINFFCCTVVSLLVKIRWWSGHSEGLENMAWINRLCWKHSPPHSKPSQCRSSKVESWRAWTPAQLQPHGVALFLILHDSRRIYWGLCAEGNVLPEETVLALAPTFSCALSCPSCKAAFGGHAAKTLHKHVSWTVEFLSLLLPPSCCCSGLNFPLSFFAVWKQINADVGGNICLHRC